MPKFLDLRTSEQSNTDTSTLAVPVGAGAAVVIGDIGLVTTGFAGQIRVSLQGYAKVTTTTAGSTLTYQVVRNGALIFTTTLTAVTAGEQDLGGFTAADLPPAPASGLIQYQLLVFASAAGITLGARAFTGVAASD
ncbi:hypothetical protein Q5741_11180 [Paenibacillus sp. JX-17]|uniref:Uncharacterized protein n=1 Tax=Paenibacillus lacisoli TaxID=3064525 RepID=A0ABT9CCI3_9BACL|nr:hypothetical protein [Paenibacillus sp. JX-17]MDO7906978.1 hypothetical protein [Paenibacillus sp. JX-17]